MWTQNVDRSKKNGHSFGVLVVPDSVPMHNFGLECRQAKSYDYFKRVVHKLSSIVVDVQFSWLA